MNRPNFEPIFTKKSEFCEISDSKPIKSFIPNQAISLRELVTRFERGQRLNVHSNFAPGSNFEHIDDEEAFNQIRSESLDTDDFPPTDAYDIADVQNYYNQHNEHKSDFNRRMKKKKEEAKQASPTIAKQAPDIEE